MFPIIRLRRNRRTNWLRDLIAETNLQTSNLVLPLFLVEGHNVKQEIKTLPGVFRFSIDQALIVAKEAESLGISAVALFPCIDASLKSEDGIEAYNLDNLVCRAIRTFKNADLKIGIICDAALDPYTTHGHDGIIVDGDVDNDQTIEALSNQALVLAKAGADIIAPSDMMDGRIISIRESLDSEGLTNVGILAYSAKYASSFYEPFRDGVNSLQKNKICKSTYQMDVRNSREAMREIEEDLKEGADMVMIKPAMLCLDIIKEAYKTFNAPIFAYQVSGEYSMMKFASLAGAINFEKCLLESLISCRRAGASSIISYGALDAARLLRK